MRLIMPGGIAEGSYPAGFQLQSWDAADKERARQIADATNSA